MSGKCDKCAEEVDKDGKEWKGISLLKKLEVPGSSWTAEWVFFKAFHSMHSCSQSLLFIPMKYNMLNTCIYHQLPPTCFGVCYTIFREISAVLACFLQFCYKVYNISCFFKFTMLLQCLKPYVFRPVS